MSKAEYGLAFERALEQARESTRRLLRETPLHKVKRLIREDRAACNDGRWVRSPRSLLVGSALAAMAPFQATPGARNAMWSEAFREIKNRYRWEYRR